MSSAGGLEGSSSLRYSTFLRVAILIFLYGYEAVRWGCGRDGVGYIGELVDGVLLCGSMGRGC